jgi:hypothetical protein
MLVMAYPSRPRADPLPRFLGTARPGARADPELLAFVVEQYEQGKSLRQIAELTNRSFSAVRNILDRAGLPRRGSGALQVTELRRP